MRNGQVPHDFVNHRRHIFGVTCAGICPLCRIQISIGKRRRVILGIILCDFPAFAGIEPDPADRRDGVNFGVTDIFEIKRAAGRLFRIEADILKMREIPKINAATRIFRSDQITVLKHSDMWVAGIILRRSGNRIQRDVIQRMKIIFAEVGQNQKHFSGFDGGIDDLPLITVFHFLVLRDK